MIEPRFQEFFVEAMAIPHKTAAYPNLSKVVDLPARREPAASGEARAERRGDVGDVFGVEDFDVEVDVEEVGLTVRHL